MRDPLPPITVPDAVRLVRRRPRPRAGRRRTPPRRTSTGRTGSRSCTGVALGARAGARRPRARCCSSTCRRVSLRTARRGGASAPGRAPAPPCPVRPTSSCWPAAARCSGCPLTAGRGPPAPCSSRRCPRLRALCRSPCRRPASSACWPTARRPSPPSAGCRASPPAGALEPHRRRAARRACSRRCGRPAARGPAVGRARRRGALAARRARPRRPAADAGTGLLTGVVGWDPRLGDPAGRPAGASTRALRSLPALA